MTAANPDHIMPPDEGFDPTQLMIHPFEWVQSVVLTRWFALRYLVPAAALVVVLHYALGFLR